MQILRRVGVCCVVTTVLATGGVVNGEAVNFNIAASAAATDMKQVSAQWQAFYRRNMLREFERRADRSAEWYGDGREFIEFILPWFTASPTAPELKDFTLQSSPWLRAHKAGCRDPLFLYLAAYRGTLEGGWPRERKNFLREAVEGFKGSEYPPNLLGLAARDLAELARETYDTKTRDEMGPILVDSWARTIEEGVFPTTDHRLLVRELKPVVFQIMSMEEVDALMTRVKAVERVDPWLVSILEGIIETRRAWAARGGGGAESTREQQFLLFAEHLKKADAALRRAWRLRADRPEAAELMVQVMNGLGQGRPQGETERMWFDRAIAAQIDWRPAYDQYIYAIMPRWGGSPEEMIAFGRECAATGRFDTRVPFFLIEAQSRLAEDGAVPIMEDRELYELTMATLEKLIESPEYAEEHTLQHSLAMTFAALWDETERASKHYWAISRLIQLGKYAERFGVHPQRVAHFVELATCESSGLVRQADDAMHAGDAARAVELYQQAHDGTGNANAKQILKDRVATARFTAAYQTGEWVNLEIDDRVRGWEHREGGWHQLHGETTRVHGSPGTDGFLLVSRIPVGPRFEIEGEFDMAGLKIRNQSNVGVILGIGNHVEQPDWQGVLFYRGEKKVAVRTRWAEGESFDAPIEPVSKFRIVVWDDDLLISVNGSPPIRTTRPDAGGPYQPCLALGGRYWYENGSASFMNLRLRWLDRRPAELN